MRGYLAIIRRRRSGCRLEARRFWHTQQTAAIHEAGHVVQCYCEGVVPTLANVVRTRRGIGLTEYGPPRDKWADLRICLAGWAAESVYRGRIPAMPWNVPADSDGREARELCKRGRLLRLEYRKTRYRIAKEWRTVQAVARLLVRKKTVRTREIARAVLRAQNAESPPSR